MFSSVGGHNDSCGVRLVATVHRPTEEKLTSVCCECLDPGLTDKLKPVKVRTEERIGPC